MEPIFPSLLSPIISLPQFQSMDSWLILRFKINRQETLFMFWIADKPSPDENIMSGDGIYTKAGTLLRVPAGSS